MAARQIARRAGKTLAATLRASLVSGEVGPGPSCLAVSLVAAVSAGLAAGVGSGVSSLEAGWAAGRGCDGLGVAGVARSSVGAEAAGGALGCTMPVWPRVDQRQRVRTRAARNGTVSAA
jgi:hypothetical protein